MNTKTTQFTLLFLFALIFTTVPNLASADSGGPDDFGYRWIDSNEDDGPEYDWENIRNDGDLIGNWDDDWIEVGLEMEFEFQFYGEVYDEINVCDNGWVSFTYEDIESSNNFDIPGGDVENMIAVAFSQWYMGEEGSVYYYSDEDMTVISYEGLYGWNAREMSTFQIILYPTGDIKFQYNSIDQTQLGDLVIGIQDEGIEVGLEINNHDDDYVENRLAIMINGKSGWITGEVSNLETGEGIEGATVTLMNENEAITDADGIYWFEYVPADTFEATVWAYGYNTAVSESFTVALDETTTVDFALTHPEIRVDIEGLFTRLDPGESAEAGFSIFNDGNGLLSFNTKFAAPRGERDDLGDVIFDLAASDTCEDARLQGMVMLDGNYYLAGGNNNDDPNYIHVLDMDGNFIRRFEQPVDDPSSRGMNSITTDGEFLYSADGREIVQFNTNGDVEETINGPFNPVTNIVYDPDRDHFWVSTTRSDIVEIDRNGDTFTEIEIEPNIYGLGWFPDAVDDYNLVIIWYEDEIGTNLYKANPETGELQLFYEDLMIEEGDELGDCFLTTAYNPLIWTLVTLVHNGADDRIVGLEFDINSSWISLEPRQGDVDAESDLAIDVVFDSEGWEAGEYLLDLVIESNAAGDAIEIPIGMRVNRIYDQTEHFEFTPTDLLHEFTITDFKIKGLVASENDEIGVFTPEGVCAGAAKWTADGSVIVPAYGDDPDTDFTEGFVDGEEPTFRYWVIEADEEGEAEFTHVSGDTTWMDLGETSGRLSVPDPDWAEHFEFQVTDEYHVFNITSVELWYDDAGTSPDEGDELAIYVGDLCISGYKWLEGDNTMIAFADDPNTQEVDGFVEGDSAIFVYWDSTNDLEYVGSFVRDSGDTILVIGGETTGFLDFIVTNVSGDLDSQLPNSVELYPAYPNPFNSSTTIRYGLPVRSEVNLRVMDLQGRVMDVIRQGELNAGYHILTWNAGSVPSGTYVVRLQADGQVRTEKVLLIR